MKKITVIFLTLLLVLNVSNVAFAFAQTDELYELVYNTVNQAYGVEIEGYQAEQEKDGSIYCTFKGGYAVAKKNNDEYIIEKLWCDTAEYFDSYLGASGLTKNTSSVSYTDKSENNKSLALTNPNYVIAGVTCVPNAATCILGFYDRYYTELIPNFTPGQVVLTNYMYFGHDSSVRDASLQLSYDMGMNDPSTDGVSVNNCKSGMQTYCARKNLSVSFSSCMSRGNFNYSTARTHLISNTPLIIFTSSFGISYISSSNSVDTITTYSANAMHCMAVFGFSEVTYTLSNGTTKTDTYLRVAGGMASHSSGLMNIATYAAIDDAYAVTIS